MDLKHETPKEAMGGHEPPAPAHPIAPGEVAYEKADVDPKSIVRVGIVLIAMTVGSVAIAFGVFRLLVTHEERNDPPPPPLGRPAEGRMAPEPRLQTAPAGELAVVREEEQRLLTGYGWADEAGGIARIPIEEAMALYVGQARAAAAAPSASPSPGASPSPSPAPSSGAHP